MHPASDDCVFCKIVAGKIPCNRIYEDQDILVFHDITPKAPVHFLMIPKWHIPSLMECEAQHQAVLGKLLSLAGQFAREQGAESGFRTIINTGPISGQEVYHVHLHILGGAEPLPPMLKR